MGSGHSYFRWFCFGIFDIGITSFDTLIVLLIYGALVAVPFIIKAIYKVICKNTALYITDDEVYGSYSPFITKKTLQIPIEKVDNLTVMTTLGDKLRSGNTLGVCSASGIIKLHFIQNASDVVAAAMSRIREVKDGGNTKQPAATPSAAPSTTDKLKELSQMKESGIISEEEYTKKREELLSKM